MTDRPNLTNKISQQDFLEFYWLKNELVDFCRNENLDTSGNKTALTERIQKYLKTGKKDTSFQKKINKKSNFDWSNEKLSLKTKITDSYKNTENVRSFFIKEIGPQFKFNVKFMNWMKENTGKTLDAAITEWHRIRQEQNTNTKPKNIAPQFEYNTYIRDFLADNPSKKLKDAIKHWNFKKSKRGNNIYHPSDIIEFLKSK